VRVAVVASAVMPYVGSLNTELGNCKCLYLLSRSAEPLL